MCVLNTKIPWSTLSRSAILINRSLCEPYCRSVPIPAEVLACSRRLARTRAPSASWPSTSPRRAADLNWRPHDPRQGIQTRQSLPARSVCPGRLGRPDQPQTWERYGLKQWITAAKRRTASQRARHRARQQARPDPRAVGRAPTLLPPRRR
jgi:hypothetical protein